MDEILYNSLSSYYNALEKLGYMTASSTNKLLVLAFYRDFMFQDYRALLSKDDYLLIEKALDCLYGSTCLIPYPDYLKMGKLHLGEMTEMAQRIKTLEDTEVLKLFQDANSTEDDPESDVKIMAEED